MYKTFITSVLAIGLISASIITQANQDNVEDSSPLVREEIQRKCHGWSGSV
ncbi:MAG: hypothetical protein JW384_03479 [Nitrosomonadaceae bacterium]|nr:hypothetical protein [Nitrosomonadaceae bacterium]